MQVGRKRTTPRNVVAAGSVWESRIKLDEVKGGIKVFNGEEIHEEAESINGSSTSGVVSEKNQSFGVRERRKTWKPEPIEVIGGIPIQVRKTRSETTHRFSLGSCWEQQFSGSVEVIEKSPIQVQKHRSDSDRDFYDSCNDFDLCKEKQLISSSFSNGGVVEDNAAFNGGDEEDEEKEEVKEMEMKLEMEKKSFNDKDLDVLEQKPKKIVKAEKKLSNLMNEKPMSIPVSVKKQPTTLRDHPVEVLEQKSKKVVKETRKLNQINEKSVPPSANVKKVQSYSTGHLLSDPVLTKSPRKEVKKCPETPKNLQKFVDLVMWRDVPKSAFCFGLGMLILVTLYFTEDLNFSLISAISYMGLVCLAAIFLYKSITNRGVEYLDDSTRTDVVGEEEAIWLSNLIINCLNECIWKLRNLFYGDPATTMKLAVFLFVLAKCGSSITLGKMIKLGFIGIFTVPKVSSLYSESGKFWLELLKEDWDSCHYKKPIIGIIFILAWSLSSVVARTWAVFMLIVSIRYYQNSSSRGEVKKKKES